MRMHREHACLLVIDVQQRLAPVMAAPGMVVGNTAVLLKAAERLGVPVLVSEQYPRGLGPTVPELAALMRKDDIVEKNAFSCMGEGGYAERFRDMGRRQAVVCGIEAHVCVLQTALDLLAQKVDVFVVADAVSSRTDTNKGLALARLRAAGAQIVSTEMVVFEWLERAGTPEFKELSGLIK